MRFIRTFAAAAGSGVIASVLLLTISCSSTGPAITAPLKIPGAHFVGNQACAECHADIVRKFNGSPHARLRVAGEAASEFAGCEACHGPGSRHVESRGSARLIINPGKKPAACFVCHQDIAAQFQLPHHHPVVEGHLNCVDCHDPHGDDIFKPAGGLAMARADQSCAACHREQTRPFVFPHGALREGCTVCHQPHGSINQKMLVADDPNLCLRCHAQTLDPNVPPGRIYIGNTDHTSYLQIGTCWTAGCHTAVHGSNVDPRLRY
jgi:predicted CXXCH cytochrome family protein